MQYKAKIHYQNTEVASSYDEARFKKLKGSIADKAEKRLIERAFKKLGTRPPAKVLDIPCGTGRLAAFLASQGFNVWGADISDKMILEAEKKLSRFIENKQVAIYQADAETLPFSDRQFDLAVSLRFFGHIPPEVRVRVLRELKRVSGQIIAVYSLMDTFQEIVRRKKRALAEIMWFPATVPEIKAEIKRAGLKNIAILHLCRGFSESAAVIATTE